MGTKANGGKRGRTSKHGGKHFVQLPEWVLSSAAWRDLSVGARSLYIELKRRYKGFNNGAVRLSHREAAKALGVHRNTVGAWFRELEAHGFIRQLEGPCLGPSGIGQTARWALDEHDTHTDGRKALKRFMDWRPDTEAPHKKQVTPSP